MPVYGGKRGKRVRGTFVVSRVEDSKIEKGRRKYARWLNNTGWSIGNTSLEDVERGMRFKIRDWIHKRAAKTNKPVVVLDWGCENGRAIRELAHTQGKEARCYGYSLETHTEWNAESSVRYIHETKEEMLRYFKDGSVDLIFSHSGLHQLSKESPLELPRYLRKLSRKLAPGGRIIFKPFWVQQVLNSMFAQQKNITNAENKVRQLFQGIIDPTAQKMIVRLEDNRMVIERID